MSEIDLNKYRYHGFLSGYANATGRPLGFAVANNDAALDAFNQGYEAGCCQNREFPRFAGRRERHGSHEQYL